LRYAVRITAALRPGSGRFAVRRDGKEVGFGGDAKAVDLHVPHRTMLRTSSSRNVELTQGDPVLTLRYEPARGRAGGETIGVDFLWVQKR